MKNMIRSLILVLALSNGAFAAPNNALIASRIESYLMSRTGSAEIARVLSNPSRLLVLQQIQNIALGGTRPSNITAKTSTADVARFLTDAYKQSSNPEVQKKINELLSLERNLAPTAEETSLAGLELVETADAVRASKITAEINSRLANGDISANLAAEFEAAVQLHPARLGEGLLGSCKGLNNEQLSNLMRVVVAGSQIADDAEAARMMTKKLAEVTKISEGEARKNLCDLSSKCDFIRSSACAL